VTAAGRSPDEALAQRIARSAGRGARKEVGALARTLAKERGAAAVLFYGSNLRTGSLDGVLDFYILHHGRQRERVWPRVGYVETEQDGVLLRAKIAQLALSTFAAACAGRTLDTTIWARFVQPAAILFADSERTRTLVLEALVNAAKTASMIAALVGPERGGEAAFWEALFGATYEAELRVERPGRAGAIVAAEPHHFDGLLPLAWDALCLPHERFGAELAPMMPLPTQDEVARWWGMRRALGRWLNLVRLGKATATFDGAARYGLWKLERHTGIALEPTPFRERHPILAAPGAWLEYRRKRRARDR
jgi:hypothetical protein